MGRTASRVRAPHVLTISVYPEILTDPRPKSMEPTGVCQKCKERPTAVESRSEYFCKECFVNYVQYKNRKRLDDFKVNYGANQGSLPKIFLPLSLGRSSIAALDMLVSLIRQQKDRNHGKTGFQLIASHVIVDPRDKDVTKSRMQNLEVMYPECEFHTVDLNHFLDTDFEDFVTVHMHSDSSPASSPIDLLDLLQSHDKSSYQDIHQILLKSVIRRSAQLMGAKCIVWGDSMTKIAQMTCSLTCKGRGESLHELLSGTIPGLDERYVMQDLLSSEIVHYLRVQDLSSQAVAAVSPPSSKRFQSIDELASEYFTSVEAGFPSVVATVVRTTSKLADPHQNPNDNRDTTTCAICQTVCFTDSQEWQQKITVDGKATDNGALIDVCYGCRTALASVNLASFKWPRILSH